MLNNRYLSGASSIALATLITLSAGQAFAQDDVEVSEVVVTGSFIAGSPEDAALPVNVIGSDEMQKQGSPSTVDLIKSIPAVSGAIGESNQFGAGQTTGSGNINLRGLGATRTLVLMNGRRMAVSPGGTSVDTNLIPTAAIGRLEVLKDGAAATYGSDAIGGVVNFITRTNLDGFEVRGDYAHIDGSDGNDYGTSIAYGWRGDRG
nr:TonB-dependent receptor plug domain-containing protein [Phenylobacterium sp.]